MWQYLRKYGFGGIGIIRISGTKTIEIIERIFKPKKDINLREVKGYQIKYGYIVEKEKVVDEVLVSFFKSPYSYTTEDMCEINAHGGVFVVRKILELCLKNGARLAQPGEFTQRAFLNGRIDLAQAESVIDIINAKTQTEARASVLQLEGYLSKKINRIRQKLMNIMVEVEVSIDYPEYDVEDVGEEKAYQILEQVEQELLELQKSFETGKLIKEGIKVALIGRPNVGKSSLLNVILKEERAIVTEIEGTTRDTIEESVRIGGVPIHIIDTAGIRNATNEVEKIGIEKSKKMIERADLIIAIFDVTKELKKEDLEILELIKDKKALIVLNKIDLVKERRTRKEQVVSYKRKDEIIELSAKEDIGLESLYKKIEEMFRLQEINVENQEIITNIRHKNIIEQALLNVQEGKKVILEKMPVDIIAIHVKEAMEELAKITGDNVSEDIIKEIFSKFCLGK